MEVATPAVRAPVPAAVPVPVQALLVKKVNATVPKVGTNGGTVAGLVGSYERVAERIEAFAEAGIELFMLQFHPLEEEIERFGAEVIPRVRARIPSAA